MAASASDRFKKVKGFFSTTLASQKNSGATTMSLADATDVPTSTGLVFTVGRVDSSGTSTPTTRAIYKGTLSGTTVSNLSLTEGTDQTHAAGTVVEMTWTETHINDLVDGLVAEHNQDGTHGAITSTNAVLTTPKVVTSINDTNGNELFKVSATSSAVNEVTVTNAATGNAPTLSATGGDTNVALNVNSKGTSGVLVNGAKPWLYLGSASATSDQGSITTITDLTSLTVTVTVPTAHTTVRIIGWVRGGNSTVDSINNVYIFEGSTQLQAASVLTRSGNAGAVFDPIYIGTATAGSHTYKLRMDNGGSGTATTKASATAPAYIIVECC